MSLSTARSTSKVSNIALFGAFDERRSASDQVKFMRASNEVWAQAEAALCASIESGEAFRGADFDTLAELEREQIDESKNIIFLKKGVAK